MEQDNKTQNKIVQTYAEDMAKVIGDDKNGLIKKIIHEEEEHEKEKRGLSPESKKNKLFMVLGFLFLSISLTTLFYFIFAKEVSTVSIEKQFIPLIFNDTSTSIEVVGFNKNKIIQTIYNTVNATKAKKGEVEGIYLINNKKNVGFREFIQLIKANFIPDTPFNDNFLMGVVNSETKDFFILFKVRSMADVFDAVRTWEKKMFSDLHGFFGLDITFDIKYLLTANFEDGIVENKNARILYDKERKIVMMYILADDNSIIITNTKNAAQEVMLRLGSSQIEK